jgi:CheY-like chemotaxis protein/anti-sigma regulatory factor (Ser/Thr protein kinase)
LKTVIEHTGTLVNADPGRVQQIVTNLLSNAIKFTPHNGHVRVELHNLDDRVEVSVADTGKGISVDFLPRIFERFSQAENTNTRTHGGLGLGLAIVRHLTELHGGSVRAQSDGEDKGSTFTITLPVTAHQDACGEIANRVESSVGAQAQHTAMPKLDGLKLLVVDDEVSTRELLHTLLEQCGAEVISTGSAFEALRMLRHFLPDVIISDIEMPGESGYDLISKIRLLPAECGGQMPAVALSAHASVEDKQRAIRTGFQRHIAKPFEMRQLVVAVSEVSKNYAWK